MSTSSRSDSDYWVDVEELIEIGTRCNELRKEKELLNESKSHSFELIKNLEQHVKSLSEAHIQDQKHIQQLERELMNCTQEIDYLQDQLSTSNKEINSLREQTLQLKLRLVDMESLQDQVNQLTQELRRSFSDRLLLMRQVETTEAELQNSSLCVAKLEESIASLELNSKCEIEGMKLDIMSLEQSFFKNKKINDDYCHEKTRMGVLIKELEVQLHNAQEIIENLDEKNKELRETLFKRDKIADTFYLKFNERLQGCNRSQFDIQCMLNELASKLNVEDMSGTGEASAMFPDLSMVLAVDGNLEETIESMSCKMHEYELVKKLKEELREEKAKAKEEAEDLAQEMAELRYQMTCLLEEERNRRACIEQASLQRIAELEAQIGKEAQRPLAIGKSFHDRKD